MCACVCLSLYFGLSRSSLVHVLSLCRPGTSCQPWLNRGSSESLGGSYGSPPPSDLASLAFTSTLHPTSTCTLPQPPVNTSTPDNTLSALTAAEWLRRLALHRDIDAAYRVPRLQWSDVQEVLFGAATPTLFGPPALTWGGMMVSSDTLVQGGFNASAIEQRSRGTWRVVSKEGSGYSMIRFAGEVLINSYACLPVVDDGGNPVPDAGGVEFVVSARVSVPKDTHLEIAGADEVCRSVRVDEVCLCVGAAVWVCMCVCVGGGGVKCMCMCMCMCLCMCVQCVGARWAEARHS